MRAGLISWVQHFTLPPPLISSLRSTGDRPVAGGSKALAQLTGTRGDEDMQPVADRIESEGVRVMLARDESIGEQFDPAADGSAD